MSKPKLWVVTIARQVLALAETEEEAVDAVADNFSLIVNSELDTTFEASPVERVDQVLEVMDQRLEEDFMTSRVWTLEDVDCDRARVVDAISDAGLLDALSNKLEERQR